MEEMHGVDVSWLHHSQKDHYLQKVVTSPAALSASTAVHEVEDTAEVHEQDNHSDPMPLSTNGASSSPSHHLVHRPHYINRTSLEGFGSSPQAISKNARDQKSTPAHSPRRRNSWMSSISSKFSSGSAPLTVNGTSASANVAKTAQSQQTEQPNPHGAAFTPGANDVKKADISASQSPPSVKSGHPSFLQNALRRLSSTGPSSTTKLAGSGGACLRRTMNLDPFRERCSISDLEPAKLRRVAFCVDVEIAPPAKYTEEEQEDDLPPPPPSGRRPSLTQLETQVEIKKKKDQKLKRSEGAALKNPQAVTEEKEQDRFIRAGGEEVGFLTTPIPDNAAQGINKESTRKREKKKRSEEERKDRKERKHTDALANGTVPAELVRNGSSGSTAETSPGEYTPPKSQDRPTTDPLRIYRRCCQLRETPILKRITEQISSPSACPVATPGIVSCLDLSGFWMQLPDIITLGDYLAVVPVKKLILENCGLGDEAIRVILAGLLAAKTPEQAKYNKRLAKKLDGRSKDKAEQIGVIEKLSLKDNPKIGREGWRHIGLFIYMSKSLKAIDLSMIPCPRSAATSNGPQSTSKSPTDIPNLLQKAITERLGGSHLEELVLAECGLDTDSIERVVDGVICCGLTRLGLAGNSLTREGFQHVLRYVKSGKCEGLDLGGNDLQEVLNMLAESLDNKNALYALSLADCNLSPSSLTSLFPALVRLPNFRFIDLSHNHDLFRAQANVLGLLRKYLPRFPMIKRVHLIDVAMSPEHAIALAEVLPESRTLAHVNILENPRISALALAKDEASQEEACALYASLMAAVRVSKSIICIDIDVPSQDSSEVVKALAKQVIAYSLRNLERMPVTGINDPTAAAITDNQVGEKQVTVPDILLHIVGHTDGEVENLDKDEAAPDEDYIVGGTGVVKALGVCLSRAADLRTGSRDLSPADSGRLTPRNSIQGDEFVKGKAKEMSKTLLDSARKIRARLQPALVREARGGDQMSYKRLQFLDSTLEGMIQRFENEYPETRLQPLSMPNETLSDVASTRSTTENTSVIATFKPDRGRLTTKSADQEEEESDEVIKLPAMSRRSSEISLASRQAQEEGRMHRFGQRMRRDLLRPETLDYAHGTTGEETEAEHLQLVRRRLENLDGEEIQESIHRWGAEAMFHAVGATAEDLRELERQNPEGVEGFKEQRLAALYHMGQPSRMQNKARN